KTKEREKAALIERAQLRRDGGEQALFDDDDLWQKREARIVAMECFTFVTTNSEALQYFEMMPLDYDRARRDFELEAASAEHWYLWALAERLIAKVGVETKELQDKLKESLLTMRISAKKIPMIDQYISDLIPLLAFHNFDLHCWPELPAREKTLLKNYLQQKSSQFKEWLLGVLEWLLKSAPKANAFAILEYIREMIRTPDVLA